MRSRAWLLWPVAAALILALAVPSADAQLRSGNVYGKVMDPEGGILPGVTVTVSGVGAPQTQVTDAQGQFRFLGLSPGAYSVTATLEGFSTVEYPNVVVNVGRNTSIEIRLSAAIEEVITVTAESPLLDERKISAGSAVSRTEMEKIPSGRDPWSVLETVPGVKVDRINVAGSESGQQSGIVGPGSDWDDVTWAMDGVVITDMNAQGGSPAYYNFDSFEEIQVSTGGSDATTVTNGVTLNMVTKRGTNEWRGTARFIRADESWQSSTGFSNSDLGAGQDPIPGDEVNQITRLDEWGGDIGGPIVKDRLWIWANYSDRELGLITFGGATDDTTLENSGVKINANVTSGNSGILYYSENDKVKLGRNASPTRPQPTTWDQGGPGDIYKIEDTHIFSSSFFLTGLYAFSEAPFFLTPQGGLDVAVGVNWDTGVWADTFMHHETERPADQWNLDADYFFSTGNVNHELKFGVSYRHVEVSSSSVWPGGGIRQAFSADAPDFYYFTASQTLVGDLFTDYEVAYIQDTMTVGKLTANIGLRYDGQAGENNDVTVPAVPGFEAYLPAVNFHSAGEEFSWSDISPRLGITYALGEDRDTLLRASYSRFAEQLRQGYVSTTSGVTPYNYRYVYFYYDNLNGDNNVTPDEITEFVGTNGFDITGAGLNQIDPSFSAPITDELIFGVEHALRPELVIGASVTWRNRSNMVELERLVDDGSGPRQHQRSDYVLDEVRTVTRPDGSTYDVPLYTFRDGIDDLAGYYYTNGDREEDFLGFNLSLNKRLANRWMARGNFSWSQWEKKVPDSEREDPNQYWGGDFDDGGPVLQGAGTGSGSKLSVWMSPGWSYSLTGLYQIAPDESWGFNVAATINGREGYAAPYYLRRENQLFVSGSGPFTTYVDIQGTADADDYKMDDVHMVNLRVEKEFTFEPFGLVAGVELFNALNDGTVLQRQLDLNSSQLNWVQETISPRIFRLSLRLNFN